ncbi:MAG: hypothetical protein Q7T20_01610 [Saprospiraceae bacterium]|nr:hypothetical protein [Saprospiraceae bacterium]
MNNATTTLPRRYPGLRPFERSQSAVFHGRGEDIAKLSNLVLRERLVVLFAKSGMGKTSLLQAGCAPELERQDFVPVFLRTERSDRPLLASISEMLEKNPHVGGIDPTGLRPGASQTLWEKMKRLEFDLNGLPVTPVLVLDQFEEAFTLSHSEESRHQFFRELADLANETMPGELRATLLEQFEYGNLDVETMQWWEEQPNVRIVLSIRSDFLHMIDRVSKSIPGILRNRYELLPLDREKARTAIAKPADQAGDYASQAFTYAPAALEEMLDFLSGHDAAAENEGKESTKAEEIEAVNLQIICQDVEERIIDFQKHAGFEVDSQFYEGQNGLRNSIRNFYQNQLRLFPKAYIERIQQKSQQGAPISALDKSLTEKPADLLHEMAQRLIEESLITPGNRRNSVVDDTLISDFHVSPDFLDTLVDKSRLLRKEPRLEDFYYEISHDTLLPAVIESRNTRRDKEQADRQKAEYQQQLAEEAKRREAVEAELTATRRQRKLARTVAITSSLSLLVCLGFAIWFIKEYVENARSQLKQAEFYVHNELYNAADHAYLELISHPRRTWILEHFRPHQDVCGEYELVKKFHLAYKTVDSNFVFADSLMLVNNYAFALNHYRLAEDSLKAYRSLNAQFSHDTMQNDWRVRRQLIDSKDDLIGKRIYNANQTLVREFKISQREYESFVEAKVWGQALRNLRRMKQLLPAHPSDEVDLKNALKINELPSEYVKKELLKCEAKLRGL